MVFVKTFKGYEDKTDQLDASVNAWVQANDVSITSVHTSLSRDRAGHTGCADLIYTILYTADAPVP